MSGSGTEPQEPLNVFSCYAPNDALLSQELDMHLRVLQRQGLIRLQGSRDRMAGSDWKQISRGYLNQAQIILLLISADFLDSDYHRGEMQRALERQESGEAQVIPILLRPVSYEGLPFSSLQLLPRDGIPVISNQWASHDEVWTQIVEELRKVIPRLAAMHLSSTPLPTPRIWHVPYRRNPFFTGREELLSQLHTWFVQENTGNAVALAQSLAIHGLGGIGKTQTALEYAYRYRHEYQTVLWVTAASEETLLADMLKLATLLPLPRQQTQDPQQTIAVVKAWLASQERWLLILDNADDLSMASAYLPEGDIQGHVLFTTRASAGAGLAHLLPVEEMEKDEGALLLLRRAKVLSSEAVLGQVREKARAEAEAIVEALGGLPLAIDQAGAYIEETGCGLAGYLRLYQTRRKELLRRRSSLPATHPEPVATTWSLSFRLIEQANPAAADLLRACAFLDPDAIPEDLFLKGGKYVGPLLAPLVEDEYAFDQAVEELRKFSLIRRNAELRTLSIHRLVQAVLRDMLQQQEERNQAERIVQILNAVYPKVTLETWERCRQLIPHVLICMTLIETYQLYSKEAGALLYRAGWYLSEQYLFAQAEAFLQRSLAIKEQTLGPEHPDTSATLNSLGLLYHDQGRYKEAESLLQRSLAIKEQTLGPEHPNTSTTLNNLGLLYKDQGKYEEAESLLQRALAIDEQTLGPEHPSTSTTLNNLGLLYKGQGRYEQAEPLYLRSLAIYEQTLGSDHPETATTLGNLATLYMAQGKYEEAEPLYQRALAIREQTLGPEHPQLAVSLYGLARNCQAQEKYEQAERLYQRVLAIDEQVYGLYHSEVATDLEAYAGLLSIMGRGEEAEVLLSRAEHIRSLSDSSVTTVEDGEKKPGNA